MYEGDGAVTEEICYALTKPAITAVTVKSHSVSGACGSI